MSRCCTMLLSCAFLFLVLGPSSGGEKKGTKIPGWGDVVDPAGDCKVIEKDSKLSITVPGKEHNLNPLPGWNNLLAPRVLREVDGDFVVQVLVRKFERPKANTSSNKEKPISFVGGGLVVWQDGQNFLRFMRAANGERDDVFVGVECFSEGKSLAAGSAKTPDEDTYLRVERKDGKHSIAVSSDGKTWTPRRPPGKDMVLMGKVRIGVAVVNATTKEIVHQFEELKVMNK